MRNVCKICSIDDWSDQEFAQAVQAVVPATLRARKHRKFWEWSIGMLALKKAMREMERVLKPGGALSLTTEICVDGVKDLLRLRGEGRPFAADIFTPMELNECILRSTGLHLEGDLDISISEQDRRTATKYPDEIDKLPHILLDYDGSLFTSVHLLFTKESITQK